MARAGLCLVRKTDANPCQRRSVNECFGRECQMSIGMNKWGFQRSKQRRTFL